MIKICSACNKLIYEGEQSTSTKGKHRQPIKMHRWCWAAKKAQTNDARHVTIGKVFRELSLPCVICGSQENIQAGHIVSRANGGSNELSNYQPECIDCNVKRGTG